MRVLILVSLFTPIAVGGCSFMRVEDATDGLSVDVPRCRQTTLRAGFGKIVVEGGSQNFGERLNERFALEVSEGFLELGEPTAKSDVLISGELSLMFRTKWGTNFLIGFGDFMTLIGGVSKGIGFKYSVEAKGWVAGTFRSSGRQLRAPISREFNVAYMSRALSWPNIVYGTFVVWAFATPWSDDMKKEAEEKIVDRVTDLLAREFVARFNAAPEAIAAERPPGMPPEAPSCQGVDRSSFALAIGIDDYARMLDVPGCRNDAEAVAQVVQRARNLSPSSVVVMTDDATQKVNRPTKAGIIGRLAGLVPEAEEAGVAFVYFSGHGTVHKGDVYLIPEDCGKDDGIRVQQVLDLLAKDECKAGQKVLVVDVCRTAAKGVDSIQPSLIKPARNIAVMLSCGEGEESFPAEEGSTQSVYSRFFVEAMKLCAADPAEPITARGLHARIAEMMKEWRKQTGKRQTPQLIIQGDADIILVPVRE